MNEQRIICALYRHLRSGSAALAPRYSRPGWFFEADLLAISKSGYVNEYEIKCSRADFRKDAEKSQRFCEGRDLFNRGQWVERRKHDLLAAGDERGPSRFWFVTPTGLLALDEVPAWAGLVEVKENRYGTLLVTFVRRAPRLHAHKASESLCADINRTLAYRFWGMTIDHDLGIKNHL